MLWRKHVLTWIILLTLAALLVPAVWSSSDIMKRVVREVELIEGALGKRETAEMTRRATNIYNKMFMETGVIPAARKTIVTEEERKTSSQMFGGSVTRLTNATNDYVIGVSALCYASLVRLLIFWSWVPYIAPFFIAVIVDGYARRQIKMLTFGFLSPVYYSLALHSMIIIIFLPALYLLVPFPVTPLFIPFWALFAAGPVMVAISNTQQLTN